MIENAKFSNPEHTMIECTINGQPSWVPADVDGFTGRMLAAYLVENAIADYEAPPATLEPITAAQAVVALDHVGLLDGVETAVALYPRTVQLWYQRAQVWERFNPYVMGIGLELGLADPQIDELFRYAATLEK
jgi:hypothetical protein